MIRVNLGDRFYEKINQKKRLCTIEKIGRRNFTISYELPNAGNVMTKRSFIDCPIVGKVYRIKRG